MLDFKRATALLATLAMMSVAGCGQTTQPSVAATPDVATLRSATATATAQPTPSAVASERPVIRPDATSADQERLYAAWAQCLRDNGMIFVGKPNPSVNDMEKPENAAFVKACASKEPESWEANNARTDPHYADNMRAELKCVKAKGISAELAGDPLGLVVTDDRQAARAMDIVGACEREAFKAVIDSYNGR
jgi:hypothetical protein